MEWQFNGGAPIYTQLVERIKLKIVSGEYVPGQRFPAVRELAQEAGVNPNTMQRAMQELERQGLLFSLRTSGRFVTEEKEMIEGTRTAMAQDLTRDFLGQMRTLGCGREEIFRLLTELSPPQPEPPKGGAEILEGGENHGDSGMQGAL